MEERTDPRIGVPEEEKTFEIHRFAIFLRLQDDSASARNLVCLRTLPSASGNPLLQVPPPMGLVRRRTSTGPTRSRSAAVKPSSSTFKSPRLVQTLLPIGADLATSHFASAERRAEKLCSFAKAGTPFGRT